MMSISSLDGSKGVHD
jgi:hypothetical protein